MNQINIYFLLEIFNKYVNDNPDWLVLDVGAQIGKIIDISLSINY